MKWLKRMKLQWDADTLRSAIEEAAEQREKMIVQAGQINGWIEKAQKRLNSMDAKLNSMQSPHSIINEATRRHA